MGLMLEALKQIEVGVPLPPVVRFSFPAVPERPTAERKGRRKFSAGGLLRKGTPVPKISSVPVFPNAPHRRSRPP